MAADPEVIRVLARVKPRMDLCTGGFPQAIAADLLGQLDWAARRARLGAIYRDRCQTLLDALAEHMPSEARWTDPSGGMFVWMTVSPGVNATALLADAVRRTVAFFPGEHFFADRPETNTLRLNFSYPAADTIAAGVARLAAAVSEHEGRSPLFNFIYKQQ